MFVGHVAVAFALLAAVPSVGPLPALLGVSFPDLLTGLLVLLGVEDIQPDPDSPRFRDVDFRSFPFSHSLVLGTGIAAIPALVFGAVVSPLVGVVFLVGSVSHWVLDVVVHPPHVSVLGFGRDRMVGLDLWGHPWLAVLLELALVVESAVLFLPSTVQLSAIAVAFALHLAMADSILGLTDFAPLSTPRRFAVGILGGYAALIGAFWWVL